MAFTLPDPGPPNLEFERPADAARLARTCAALIARGFKAQVAEHAEHAKQLVLDALPDGAEVHAALSETLKTIGVTAVIDESGRYDSLRKRLLAMDRATQGREMQKLGAAPDYMVGSAHAITDDGIVVVASGSGSQLGAYAYSAASVTLVVGHQKLVRDLSEARRRLVEYCLPREHARMQSIGRPGSVLARTLTLEAERGGRVSVILVPATLGF